MQSLGQAVYRYVCACGIEGVGVRRIETEMTSRGYLPPIKERVEGALDEYLHATNPRIVLRGCHYIHKATLEAELRRRKRERRRER